MSVLAWYFIFALTTAFAAMYELIGPVLQLVELTNPEDQLISNKPLTYLVFFMMSILCAPFLIVACIVPAAGNTFRQVLLKSLVG